jgi:hypothetical protein
MGSSSATLPPGPISGEASIPARSKKGLVIGIGAALAMVLAAVVFTTTRKTTKTNASTGPATAAAITATAPVKSASPVATAPDSAPATSASAAPSADIAGIDPSALPTAGANVRVAGPYDGKGRVGGPLPDKDAKDKDAKDKDAKDKDAKKKPTQGGFVPPPLTDPGFLGLVS